MDIDLSEARAALAAAGRRTTALLRAAGDGARPLAGCDWTIGELGAHLAVALRGFVGASRGDFEVVAPFLLDGGTYAERTAAVTAGTLGLEPERDPSTLAALVDERVAAFLAATDGRPGDDPIPTPWYRADASLSLATATTLLMGEQVVHGLDLARTLGRPWTISPPDARLMIRAATSMMPLAVNPAGVAGLRAAYDVRVAGGPRFTVRAEDGSIRVEEAAGGVDCHLAADPVALVLVAYGRTSQWGPIARGQLRAWGRRPWLGLRFKSLFFNP